MRSPFHLTPRAQGPALRRRGIPVAGLTVSVIGHVVVFAAVALAVMWAGWNSSRVYVVNLVPAVAARGSLAGVSGPSLPPRRAETPPSRVTRPEPEPREARAPEPAKLPDLAPLAMPRLASPPAALPRAGEKEPPPLALPTEHRPPTPPTAARAGQPMEARPAPPPSLGQPTGSVTGAGTLTLDVSDFPYAWYLRQVLQKVEDKWERQMQASEPAQKPLILVEIQRDGSIRAPRIEKSSGNAFYDQAALRAIAEASPFPPLPQDWSKPSLRVMFRFELRAGRG